MLHRAEQQEILTACCRRVCVCVCVSMKRQAVLVELFVKPMNTEHATQGSGDPELLQTGREPLDHGVQWQRRGAGGSEGEACLLTLRDHSRDSVPRSGPPRGH